MKSIRDSRTRDSEQLPFENIITVKSRTFEVSVGGKRLESAMEHCPSSACPEDHNYEIRNFECCLFSSFFEGSGDGCCGVGDDDENPCGSSGKAYCSGWYLGGICRAAAACHRECLVIEYKRLEQSLSISLLHTI